MSLVSWFRRLTSCRAMPVSGATAPSPSSLSTQMPWFDAGASSLAHNAFALDMYRSLSERSDNIVFSPLSARACLGMVGAGARGTTADALTACLHAAPSSSLQQELASLVRAMQGRNPDDAQFALAVRIGTEPPRGAKLVSVDAQSVTQTILTPFRQRKGLVRSALAMGAAALLGTAVTIPAAADPAVSALNGSLIVRGGNYDLNNIDDGKGEGDEHLDNAHGIVIDRRKGAPTLLITDRTRNCPPNVSDYCTGDGVNINPNKPLYALFAQVKFIF